MEGDSSKSRAPADLRTLANVSSRLASVGTALKVPDAFDDKASVALARALRATAASLETVNDRLRAGKGLIDGAVRAGSQISESLAEINAILAKLADGSLTADTRHAYEHRYDSLRQDILTHIREAGGEDGNLLAGAGGDAVGMGKPLQAHDLKAAVYDRLGDVAGNPDAARALVAESGDLIKAVADLDQAMTQLTADGRRLTNRINFNNAIADAHAMADTPADDKEAKDDLAKEGARLQSLQARQQLSDQSLSIANQSPQTLIGLIR